LEEGGTGMAFEIKKSSSGEGRNLANLIRISAIGGGALVLLVAQVAASPSIISSGGTLIDYLVKMITSVTSIGLIAAGTTLVIITGKIDISTGQLMMITAIFACSVATEFSKVMNPAVAGAFAILIPLAIGLACGAFNGLLIGVLRLNDFVVTMSTMYIFQGIIVIFNNGRAVLAPQLPIFSFIGHGKILGIPFPIIILAIVCLILGFVLHKTVFGRRLFAVGGNPTAARFSGINSRMVVFAAYTITGLMAALAGVFVASWTNSSDRLLGTGKEFNAITAIVLGGAALSGGIGTMWGTVLGVIFMGALEMFYIQFGISVMMQWFVKGTFMLAVIYINSLLEASQSKRKSA
jgi:ribose/xylose/arabinose/galactoside ABC-type transport system permease subunit